MDITASPDKLKGLLIRRFLTHWEGLRRGRDAPARADLNPRDFLFCLPNVLLIDLSHRPLRVFYRLVGTAVVHASRKDFTGAYLDQLEFPSAQPLADWLDFYRRMIEARRPYYARVPVSGAKDEERMFEVGIFPLSASGGPIDKVIAVEDYGPIGASEKERTLILAGRSLTRVVPDRDAI